MKEAKIIFPYISLSISFVSIFFSFRKLIKEITPYEHQYASKINSAGLSFKIELTYNSQDMHSINTISPKITPKSKNYCSPKSF
jgi:hypothetical protein